jgi:hypothetical protein
MSSRRLLANVATAIAAAALLSSPGTAQSPQVKPAYPERDILTPFRACDEIVAPPEKVFAVWRKMRAIAEAAGAKTDFDAEGREVVDDPQWLALRAELDALSIDAGHLAQVIRGSRNNDDRELAFYGMFFCNNVDAVFNLIGHIPGEPTAATRQKAYPRAVAYLRAHIGKRWGDLSESDRQTVLRGMPKVGSPEAKAMGITRAPRDEDQLHQILLRPFFQMLDRKDALDQAQALWFLKECFLIRIDLASQWVEPALPRIEQLLVEGKGQVASEAEGLLRAIGAKDLPALAADANANDRLKFADLARRRLFPPIRQISSGVVLLQPGADRDALLAAAQKALADSNVGETANGKTKDGNFYRGYRIVRVPDELAALRIPVGAILTSVNGTPIGNAEQLRAAVAAAFVVRDDKGRAREVSMGKLVVEYLLDGQSRAMEYRVE